MNVKRWGAVLLGALALAFSASAAEKLNVQVREAILRASPSMLAAPTATVPYATSVTVMERSRGWARVTGPGNAAGWLHESALTRKRLELRAGDENVATGASTREVALAGKGFSDQIETEFRKANSTVDFAWVDRMEKMLVPVPRLAAFLKDGGVEPKGDAK